MTEKEKGRERARLPTIYHEGAIEMEQVLSSEQRKSKRQRVGG